MNQGLASKHDHRQPLERRCHRLWSLGMTLGAAAEPAAKKEAPKEEPRKEATQGAKQEKALTYTGKVTEAGTGKPLPGATVIVRRSVYTDPRTQENRIVQETRHETDAQGKYTFTIPPEQVAEPRLYIELDVYHPTHAPRTGFGYSLAMIRKNETLGERPFFEHVELRPGKEVTGVVQTPDTKPAAGVKVLTYSVGEGETFGSFGRARTDARGRFRVVMATPGQAVFRLLPEKYAPSTHVIKDKRGDVGTFILQKGITVKGKVLDVKGKPVAGVWVNAARERQPGDDEIFNRVANAVNRSALRMECAQCHKHPFDRWTQADYRAYANVFAQTKFGSSPELRAAVARLLEERRRAP